MEGHAPSRQAQLALLGGDRVLWSLLRSMALAEGGTADWGLRQAAEADVLAKGLADTRHGDAQSAVTKAWRDKGSGTYGLDFLADMAGELLELAGDHIRARPEKVIEYQRLLVDLHPAVLMGALLAQEIDAGDLELNTLPFLAQRQCPLGLPEEEPYARYADNHVHLGGISFCSSFLLEFAARSKLLLGKEGKCALPRWFRLVGPDRNWSPVEGKRSAIFILQDVYALLFHCFEEFALAEGNGATAWTSADRHYLRSVLDHEGASTEPRHSQLSEYVLHSRGNSDLRWLLITAIKFRRDGNDDQAFLLLMTALCLAERRAEPNSGVRPVILGILLITHVIRRTMIMQGVGLDSFIEFFNSATRKKNQAFALAFLTRQGRAADIKTGCLKDKPRSSLKGLVKMAKITREGGTDEEHRPHPWSRYHLTHHFSRSLKERGDKIDAKALRAKAQQIRFDADHLRTVMCSSELSEPGMIAGRPLQQVVSTRIRGLDVAGNENDFPIEIFAPSIRYLRDRPVTLAEPRLRLVARRILSVHAGEDFASLLTGLRRVAETVEFCAMGKDDRIGHALALGLSPADWAAGQREAVVPLRVYLDDMVWLWSQARTLAGDIDIAARILPLLDQRIALYSRAVYGEIVAADDLLSAWRLRRNCSEGFSAMVDGSAAKFPETRHLVPDALVSDRNSKHHHLHQCYLNSVEAPWFRWTEERFVTITMGTSQPRTHDRDTFSSLDLDFIEAVQDHLMSDYDRRGIVLEACPSSNVAISRIPSCREHPLMRWRPPCKADLQPGGLFNRFGLRRGPVQACINTDDPGIFPTTIGTEHLLMKEAVKERFGLSHWEADQWIDSIRRIGVELFERNHVGVVDLPVIPPNPRDGDLP
jgi:hypothetical protein